MKTYTKVNAKELSKIVFDGFEITEAAGDGSDLRLLTIEDRTSGAVLKLTCGSYHEFSAFVEKPRETVKKFELKGTWNEAAVTRVFDTQDLAEGFASENDIKNPTITEIDVDKD